MALADKGGTGVDIAGKVDGYFRIDPLPGRNALVPMQSGEKTISYPARPVDTSTDFEGTTSIQPPQQVSSGNGSLAAGSVVPPRVAVARPLSMVAMQRMPAAPNMAPYNIASQAGIGASIQVPFRCNVVLQLKHIHSSN
ncbi:hypothetical protein HPP92_013986 [Vanilla planifolia]|uniref:Uncharacterized protein n=1 Tax=Vanilla planifolia TaxID=51239 RepID=A0A835QQ29_VANPL|nr:hypothetical protein HPP92_013986 [Vanilla planifolia]